jgi:5'-nucleotidase
VKQLTILIDLDSILADLNLVWYSTWNDRTGDNLTPEKVLSWDVHKYCNGFEPMEVYSILNAPGFYQRLPVLPGAIEAVRTLWDDGHRIIIVTAAPHEAPTAHYDKRIWVNKHLPFLGEAEIVSTHSKDVIKGDVLIDDGPHNIEAFRKQNPAGFIATIEYPYNIPALSKCNFVGRDYKDTAMAWRGILASIRSHASYLHNPSRIEAELANYLNNYL